MKMQHFELMMSISELGGRHFLHKIWGHHQMDVTAIRNSPIHLAQQSALIFAPQCYFQQVRRLAQQINLKNCILTAAFSQLHLHLALCFPSHISTLHSVSMSYHETTALLGQDLPRGKLTSSTVQPRPYHLSMPLSSCKLGS